MAKSLKLDHRGPADEMYFDQRWAAGYAAEWKTSSENLAKGHVEFMDAAFTTQGKAVVLQSGQDSESDWTCGVIGINGFSRSIRASACRQGCRFGRH